jgi:hypothetical protein
MERGAEDEAVTEREKKGRRILLAAEIFSI